MTPRRALAFVAAVCAACGALAGGAVWIAATRPNTAQETPQWPPSRSSTSKP